MKLAVTDFAEVVKSAGLQLAELQIMTRLAEVEKTSTFPNPSMRQRLSTEFTTVFNPLSVSPKLFAECLKEVDMDLFRKIPRRAFVIPSLRAPRTSLAKQFNGVAEWAATIILNERKIIVYVSRHFSWLIDVADNCATLKDFHGFLAIVSGLHLGDVRGLRDTHGHTLNEHTHKKLWAKCDELSLILVMVHSTTSLKHFDQAVHHVFHTLVVSFSKSKDSHALLNHHNFIVKFQKHWIQSSFINTLLSNHLFQLLLSFFKLLIISEISQILLFHLKIVIHLLKSLKQTNVVVEKKTFFIFIFFSLSSVFSLF